MENEIKYTQPYHTQTRLSHSGNQLPTPQNHLPIADLSYGSETKLPRPNWLGWGSLTIIFRVNFNQNLQLFYS